jgi:CBASS immunity sensor of nucleotide second messenger signals
MAAPIFLSYRWIDGSPPARVDTLDREMRLRGVPLWRDVRELAAGGLNETVAGDALRNLCCGCILYFTETVLDSWFIESVELAAVRHRVERDGDFFVTAVFDGVGSHESETLRQRIGVDPANYQGIFIDQELDFEAQIRPFATQVLRRYLATVASDPTVVAVDTWNEIPVGVEAPVHLNWAGGDSGAGPLPIEPELLTEAARDLEAALRARTDCRDLQVGGNIHLSAAFLVGYTFREPTGWMIGADHARAAVEIVDVTADSQGWRLNLRPNQNDSTELVVQVCASAECGHAVRSHRGNRDARAELGVFPADGGPGRTSLEGVQLNPLAAAVVAAIREARERYAIGSSELYLACPWTLAMALGWNFASSGRVIVHEATPAKDSYHPNPLRLP